MSRFGLSRFAAHSRGSGRAGKSARGRFFLKPGMRTKGPKSLPDKGSLKNPFRPESAIAVIPAKAGIHFRLSSLIVLPASARIKTRESIRSSGPMRVDAFRRFISYSPAYQSIRKAKNQNGFRLSPE